MDAREVWSSVAQAYARQADRAFQAGSVISEWLLEAVSAGPDTTILDLAAGPGGTSFMAAERGARVICSDNAPGMVELAERTAAERGVTGIDFRVLNAMQLDVADRTIDGVVCRYGLMLMPDPATVLSEAGRVLRPGGAVAYAVWGPAQENVWAGIVSLAALRCGFAVPPPPGPGGMFVLAEHDENVRLARAAGFGEVEVTQLRAPMRFSSFDEYWSLRMDASPTSRRIVEPLTPDEVVAVRRAAEDLAEHALQADGSLTFDTLTVAVRAS